MLILSPEIVRFDSHAWDDALALAVDRAPKRLIEEHSDAGPFAVFVDVPEQTITIRVQRTLSADDADDPALGSASDLVFYLAPTAALARKRITISCVLTAIRTELPTAGKPATKTYTFLATSPAATDPITIIPAALSD